MLATSAIKGERIEGNGGSRLKLALLVIATAQLMLVLDECHCKHCIAKRTRRPGSQQ